LKRVIQKSLQDPLAEEILAGNVADGDTVEVGAGKDGLTLKAGKSKARAA
jgi:ATP-dependent Clp protease ATP-binding subunit ClpB